MMGITFTGDMRGDLVSDLMLVAEQLEMQGDAQTAHGARDAAFALSNRELSGNRAMKLLCRYENLLG
jgi:hypothetical protein